MVNDVIDAIAQLLGSADNIAAISQDEIEDAETSDDAGGSTPTSETAR